MSSDPPVAPALVFSQVSKIYGTASGGRLAALQDVSFTLPPNRVVAIVGRSGSGKSTLLHLAAGIDAPSSGAVCVAGRDLQALSERERTLLRRERIGLVFQFFHLLPDLTVLDNVTLPELIAGGSQAEARARALDLLHRVHLAHRAKDPVQQLSGGEMQRAAICRAILRRPSLLLADEPTGNLDDAGGRAVMELLLGLAREEGRTLLYVTHSAEFAAMADARWRLHSGVLETP